MGGNHETKGRDFPLLNELDHYSSLRPNFVVGSATPSFRARGVKVVSVNSNGVESISFTNREGQALASCLSGDQYPTTILTGVINVDAANVASNPIYQDIHIGASTSPTSVTVTNTGATSSFVVIDLLSNTTATTAYSNSQILNLAPGFYRLQATSGSFNFSYPVHYGNFSYVYYDDAGRAVATVAPNGLPNGTNFLRNPSFDQDQMGTTTPSGWQSTTSPAGASYTETQSSIPAHTGAYYGCQWQPSGSWNAYTYQVAKNLPNGLYTLRAWVKSTGGQLTAVMRAQNYGGSLKQVALPNLNYWDPWQQITLTDIAVTNGQCEVGFYSSSDRSTWILFDDVELVRQADSGLPTFVTRNTFDAAGRLLSTTTPDEGKTQYVYARDGRIRFSQSARQNYESKFSYSNYDALGRVLESGEYLMVSDRSKGLVFESPAAFASQLYEAENAQRVNAGVGMSAAGYSGSGFVENITQQQVGTNTQSASSVLFTVTAPTQGSYAVDMRYASSSAGTRTMSVYVNGVYNQQASFPGTNGWAKWSIQTMALDLHGGTNTIEYRYGLNDSGWINLDYIRVLYNSTPMMNTASLYEAETAGIITPAGIYTSDPTASNGKFVGNLNSGAGVTFTVNVPTAGAYALDTRYAASGSAVRTLTVTTGSSSVQAQFPVTGGWDVWAQQTVPVLLLAGSNTIQYQVGSNDNGLLNLDYVQVRPTLVQSILTENVLEDRTRAGGLEMGRCSQRNQVWYDQVFQDAQLNGRVQEFVLGAVSKTNKDGATTWYSYNDLGQLTWMVQEQPVVGIKTLDYTYDAAGNVLTVAYQKGQTDAFYHHYQYDANQRLTTVFTSPDGGAKTLRASYSYYLHGPLKRVELAGNLQGLDYTYTVQGWLKSINNAQKKLDPGQDSPTASGMFKDLFGMRLEYFDNDYRSKQQATLNPTVGLNQTQQRYDGTVRAVSWQTAASTQAYGMGYLYDAKGQLLEADFATVTAGATFNFGPKTNTEDNLRYDANGNLSSLRRFNGTGAITDNFSYQYQANTNKLTAVNNPAGTAVLDYDYDATGQMIRQRDEKGQRYLRYDVTGKVIGVYQDNAYRRPIATFTYDDRGFRASKASYSPTGQLLRTTYSVRDLQGAEMSTYVQEAMGQVQRTEVPIYGGSRLGTLTTLDDNTVDSRYELNDHLGNARVVFHKPTTDAGTETMELGVPPKYAFQGADLYRAAPASGGHNGSVYVAELDGRSTPKTLRRVLSVQKGDTITFTAWAKAPGNFAHPNAVSGFPQARPFLLLGAAELGGTPQASSKDGQRINAPTGANRWPGRITAGVSFSLSARKQPSVPSVILTGPQPQPLGSYNAWIQYQVKDENGNNVGSPQQVFLSK